MEAFDNLIYTALGIVWHDSVCWYMLGVGLLFTILLRGAQFRYLPKTISMMFRGRKDQSDKGISNWSGLMMTVGSRVGTGNIVGVAAAICTGGPGAVFWMWMVALLGSASSFIESTLAQIYKSRSEDGQYYGGQSYYAEKGLGIKWYATLVAVILLAANVFGNPTVQSNTISSAVYSATGAPMLVVGVIVTVVLGFIIFGGIRRLSDFANKLVPVMCVLYLAIAILLIVTNITKVPGVIALIVTSAFNAESALGGLVGSALSMGVRRGVYSSEAGLGSGSATAAAVDASHPVEQGMTQSLSVFIDTVVICTITALVVMIPNCYNVMGPDGTMLIEYMPGVDAGAAYVQAAIGSVLPFGEYIVAFLLVIFAFTSLMGYYYLAETAFLFLVKKASLSTQKTTLNVMRVFFLFMVLVSSTWTSQRVWNLCDVGGGLLAWSHITLILLICMPAVKALRDYDKQLKAGIEQPVFDPVKLNIKNADLWTEINAERAAKK